jgi:hypothetical protein
MNIDLTDFWIDRPFYSNTNNFSILSDKWCSLKNCTIVNGKAYYYNGLVDKYQLKCIVIDDTFYFDFSANSITDVIKQQMWILKHTKGIEYKIEFVCLWEMFNLPTVEQLNEFAKIKQETVIPQVSSRPTQAEYDNAIEEMRLSTRLSERSQLLNIHYTLDKYVDLMIRMTDTRLNDTGVIRHATVIHNYHNPVVELPVVSQEPDEQQYRDSVEFFTESTELSESGILPEDDESLEIYINSLSELDYNDEAITHEDIVRHATIVYNYHRST